MARKVNKKFVIVLCAAVLSACTGYGALRFINHVRNQNPEVLKARGEAAEKAGDLKTAAGSYAAAAAATVRKHLGGADDLYVHAAELFMQVSETAKTDEDAIGYYRAATATYDQALQENPRNKEASSILLELQYQSALSEGTWKWLEETATKQIARVDGAKPRAYRALARLRTLNRVTMKRASFDPIDEDIEKAVKFDPDYGLAVALQAETMWKKGFLVVVQSGTVTPEIYRQVATGALTTMPATGPASSPATAPSDSMRPEIKAAQDYFAAVTEARALLQGFLDKHGLNSDIVYIQAQIAWDQYRQLHRRDLKDAKQEMANRQQELAPTISLLEKAQTADPANTQLLMILDTCYQETGQPEKSEQVYRQLVQTKPDGPEAYFILASFYRQRNEFEKAVEQYKESLKHQQVASGLDAIRNRQFQTEAVEAIASVDMDIATSLLPILSKPKPPEQEKTNAEKVKVLLKEVGEYTDRLRSSHAPKGQIDLLDGRALLINRNIPRAMDTLRQAAANLNGTDSLRLREAKLLLAAANRMITPPQVGAAIALYREALEIRSDDHLIVELGTLLNASAEYDEARSLMQGLLGEPHKVNNVFDGTFEKELYIPDPTVRDGALRVWATSTATYTEARGDAEKVFARLSNLPDDHGATLQLALTEFSSEQPADMAAAAADARRVIDKPEGVSKADLILAYQVAVTALSRTGSRDEAKELAAEAVKKYPTEAKLKYLQEQTNSPDGTVSSEVQLQILEAIPDEFTRQSQLGYFYHGKDPDKEIAALQGAEKLVENSTAADARENLSNVIDRIFVAAAGAAIAAKDDAPRSGAYWATASAYVQKAVKLNLDGVDGKLFLGRLELLKSNYQTGLAQVEAAVAQRQDYAFGHLILAQAYYQQKDWTDALNQFRTVITLSPNNTIALQFAVDLLLHKKGDPASRKEAVNYLQAGFHLAPNNPKFAEFGDELEENLDQAITIREKTRLRDPNNVTNIMRLAMLQARKSEKTDDYKAKMDAISTAVSLVKAQHEKDPKDLDITEMLARLLITRAKVPIRTTSKELIDGDALARYTDVETALGVYVPFINDADPEARVKGLLSRGDFVQKVPLLGEQWGDTLVKKGLLTKTNLIDEAATTFQAAMALEKPHDDSAERHLGDMYFDLGSSDELKPADRIKATEIAEEVYQKAISKNESNDIKDSVMKRLIETQLRLANHQGAKPDDKHLAEAVKNLNDLLDRHPTDVEGLILRGFAYIQQEKKDAALGSLNAALKLSPNNPDALYYRAEAETRLGDNVDLAIKDLLAAHDRDSSPNSRLRLAQIYRGTQHYGEAALYYQEVVDLRPDFYSARLEYAQFLYRLAALQKNLPTDSDEAFVRAIRELDPANKLFVLLKDAQQRFPTQPQWFLMYADLEAMRGLDREAQGYYEGLYRFRPGDPEIVDAYVLSLIKTQKYKEAIDLISPLLEVKKNQTFIDENPTYVVFYLRRAAAYKGLGKTAEAIADLDKALAFSIDLANQPETNLSPFVIVIDEGSTVLSREVVAARLRDRLASHPDELVTQIGLLQVLTTLNQPEEAVKLADSIHVPEKGDLLRGQALRQMGLAHYQAKKYEAASKDFTELLKIYPDDVDSLNNYAYMLADGMNNPTEALPHIQRAIHLVQTRSGDDAVKVTATAANLYDTLGYIYLKANKVDDAIAAFRHALNTQPLPPAYLHLATAYVLQKNYPLAQPVAAKGVKMAQLLNDETLPELRKLSNEIDYKMDPLNK